MNPKLEELVDDIESELVIPLLDGRDMELYSSGDNCLYIKEDDDLVIVIRQSFNIYDMTFTVLDDFGNVCGSNTILAHTKDELLDVIRRYIV